MEQPEDPKLNMVDLLPDDVLADILRRLAPRPLAACRCVCKPWRAVVDGHRLLRADLLPLSLGGIFVNFHEVLTSFFLRRPSARPPAAAISGKFEDFTPSAARSTVVDHCNGLLLLRSRYVVNPATQRWAAFPEPPPPRPGITRSFYHDEYLVFDPTVSPHYEVFLIPSVTPEEFVSKKLRPKVEESEWPPSPCFLSVFSSSTGQWEERSFVREGEAAGTIADMRSQPLLEQYNAVYWKRALYVHREANFVMRISPSKSKYQVIKLPIAQDGYVDPFLARSEKGVYLAVLDRCHLRVWILNESCEQMKWELKYDKEIQLSFQRWNYDEESVGPWTLHYSRRDVYDGDDTNYNAEVAERKFEWDSDSDDVLDLEDRVQRSSHGGFLILGFHPYKEVIFLDEGSSRGLAYHLGTSKAQDLGRLRPNFFDHWHVEGVNRSFVYTPCWIGELSNGI
uniref:F-box domain-containing protein n=1 Tax=Oryza rufipogon TaxID=4529 RepID=A0A0E0NV87_ORYRU